MSTPPAVWGGIEPLDVHNRALLSHVHPSDWRNPEPRDRYHLVVIGAGTGGLVTAAAAAGLGARVALVERHLMGGDCLNVGCVPSKALLRAAHAWHDARTARARFGGPDVAGAGDFGFVMERMRRIRAGIAPVDGAPRFATLGVDVFLGEARLTSDRTASVDGRTLRFGRAVIATGARPAVPPISGLAEAGYLTNETVFELTRLPERLAVIGAGPIGCELAQAMARFGSRITVLDAAPHVLPREDRDAADIVANALRADGVTLQTGAAIKGVRRGPDDSRIIAFAGKGGDQQVEVDAILVAAGRTPNVDGLGLEQAGVEFDAKGVRIDERLRTTNRRIFAVGDVCSRYQFTHVADWHARLVVQNALFFGRAKHTDLVVPWTTYTSPEIAHVGMSMAQAREDGIEVDTLAIPFEHVDRAILDDATNGLLRVHLARGSDRILGATLVAEHAGDMISEMSLAMTARLGLSAIGRTIHPYPTQAEVFRKAADQWRRGKLTGTVQKLLGWYFRFRG
jgi:pyruvate/2-oxoglutarate dehydrogenase complex dihydrolipoamide dehydrogenase (E3) component